MRAAFFAAALALLLGLALGLLLTGPGASGAFGSQLWIVVLILVSMFLGWQAAQLTSTSVGVLAAPIFVVLMLAGLLAVKLFRWPAAPLVGDGFGIVVAIYGAAGTVGALLGRIRALRAKTSAGAARIGLLLATVAVCLSAVRYVAAR